MLYFWDKIASAEDQLESNESFKSSKLPSSVDNRSSFKINTTFMKMDLVGIKNYLDNKIGYSFRNLDLLDEALTHCSIQVGIASNITLHFTAKAIVYL